MVSGGTTNAQWVVLSIHGRIGTITLHNETFGGLKRLPCTYETMWESFRTLHINQRHEWAWCLNHTYRNFGCLTRTPNYLIKTNGESYRPTINDIRCEGDLEPHVHKTSSWTSPNRFMSITTCTASYSGPTLQLRNEWWAFQGQHHRSMNYVWGSPGNSLTHNVTMDWPKSAGIHNNA